MNSRKQVPHSQRQDEEDYEMLISHAQPNHSTTSYQSSQDDHSLDIGAFNGRPHQIYELDTLRKVVDTSKTAYKHDAPYENLPPTRHALWQPFWLRKTTLLGLALLFTVLGAALLILWRFSIIQNGISLKLTSNSYAWTYGPTAVLVVVVSLWRQVDYHCKSLSPWQNLRDGPAPASRTVLLEYISLVQVNAFVKAIQLRNYAVVISIVGFALLKLIVIFSTGLLVSTPTFFTNDAARLSVTTAFDAIAWNATWENNIQFEPPSLITTMTGVYSNPVYEYYGIQFNGMNPLPGTSGDHTFQTFHQLDPSRNTTNVTTIVDVFVPTNTCEIGNVTITNITADNFDRSTAGGSAYLYIDTPTCRLGHGYVTDDGDAISMFAVSQKNPRVRPCGSREITAEMQWSNCSTPIINNGTHLYDAANGDYRWVLTLADIRYNQTFGPDNFGPDGDDFGYNITSWSRDVHTVAAVVCSISYEMKKLPVTYSYNADGSTDITVAGFQNTSSNGQLPAMANTQFNQVLCRTLNAASTLFPLRQNDPTDTPDGHDILVGLMDRYLNGDGSYTTLLSSEALQEAAVSTLNGISGLLAQDSLLVPVTQNSTGSVTYAEDRLHVRPLSLWLMVVSFMIMTLLSLALVNARPYRVVPCNPNSLGASAAILKASEKSFERSLTDLGYSRRSYIRSSLRGQMFLTSVADHFSLKSVAEHPPQSNTSSGRNDMTIKKSGKWYPWSVRYAILLPTVIIPIIAIIVLEILAQISKQNNGIATISSKTTENVYYYATSFVMLLIATVYNSLDFTIASFAPFSALRSHSVSARRGITSYLLGEIPVLVLWRAIRARHYGATLSNIAGLIGSTLTIIASGLWTLDSNTLISKSVSVNRIDTWNTTWNSVTNDSGAAAALSMVQHQNLSYPRWTYDELAFPKVGNTQNDAIVMDGSNLDNQILGTNRYKLTLPALRANLNCSLISADQFTTGSYTTPSTLAGYVEVVEYVVVQAPLPPQCQGGPLANTSTINMTLYSVNGVAVDGVDPGVHAASMYDLLLLNLTTYETNQYNSQEPDNPAGCPSLGFVIGYLRANSTPPENITAMICSQELQELNTAVVLKQDIKPNQIPEAAIDETTPPVPDENSIRLLTNGTDGVTSFPWRPEHNLASGLQAVNQTGMNPDAIHVFFNSIFNSSGTYSPEEYMHPENADKLIRAINHEYRQYMAQVINSNMRVSLLPSNNGTTSTTPRLNLNNNANPTTTFTGLRTMPLARLKINPTSKLILQIFLAAMTVCGTLAFLLTKIRGTLAHNPCTIAGTMTLLAGSELSEKMPVGSEWLSETQLERLLSQSGWLYSLGWWDGGVPERNVSGDQAKKRFGVDIGRAEWEEEGGGG